MRGDISRLVAIFSSTHPGLERMNQALVGHGQFFVAHDAVTVAATRFSIVLWTSTMYAHEVAYESLSFDAQDVPFQPSFQSFLPRLILTPEGPRPRHMLVCVLLTQCPRVKVSHHKGSRVVVLPFRVLRHG